MTVYPDAFLSDPTVRVFWSLWSEREANRAEITRLQKIIGEQQPFSVVVKDKAGAIKDLDWASSVYGIHLTRATLLPGETGWRLVEAQETEGPAAVYVACHKIDGSPLNNVPVAFHWPDAPALGAGAPNRPYNKAIVQKSEGNEGASGFGLGAGAYTPPGQPGPHTIWIDMPEYKTDSVSGIGMVAGTNHRGLLRYTFQLVKAGDA